MRQHFRLNAPTAKYAPSVGTLVESNEGVGNVLEMLELAIVYLEGLQLHTPVQNAFQRHDVSARLLSQGERFHSLG
jgi:hypothetical protein